MAESTVEMITVALDIGRVCIQLNDFVTASFFPSVPDGLPALLKRYGTGELTTEEWAAETEKLFSFRYPRQFLMEKLNEQIGPAMPGMEAIIRGGAERGVRFIFLSDTNPLHMARIRRTIPFCHLFSGEVLSYEAGCCKPAEKIYRVFEEKYGRPDLYKDDLPENVEGARRLGWNATQFTSAEEFRIELEDLIRNKQERS